MNTTSKLDVLFSALTAFCVVAGGSIVTVISSQAGGTAALNKTAWILSCALGLVAAAKDARSLLKLPPLSPAAMAAAAKATVALVAIIFLVGCSTVAPLVTPAALTSEVSVGIQVGLDVYPAAAPDVALARDVICSESGSTNVNPAAIIADLTALNITNSNSKLIVDSALLVYEGVYTLIGTNTTTQIEPYLTALCAGFTAGLPPATPSAKVSRKPLPPHL